jgi:undecaprenyl-diphosphatase
VLSRPYPSAPVFPSFLDRKLHDVAFQTTDPGGSSRRRHHARWWLTDFTCHGRQVWVATASYDAGVGVGRLFPIPIHHIDPDIDAERDYIVRALTSTRRVRVTQTVRVTEPMAGRNAAGDRFYTGGIAFVLA